ncbi:hypothetical protein JOE48_000490 [Methylobacterium sp. PvR107]|nr:hypothetical protein [Methylobacterium sp. PvR107]
MVLKHDQAVRLRTRLILKHPGAEGRKLKRDRVTDTNQVALLLCPIEVQGVRWVLTDAQHAVGSNSRLAARAQPRFAGAVTQRQPLLERALTMAQMVGSSRASSGLRWESRGGAGRIGAGNPECVRYRLDREPSLLRLLNPSGEIDCLCVLGRGWTCFAKVESSFPEGGGFRWQTGSRPLPLSFVPRRCDWRRRAGGPAGRSPLISASGSRRCATGLTAGVSGRWTTRRPSDRKTWLPNSSGCAARTRCFAKNGRS